MNDTTQFLLIRHGETQWNVQQRFQGHSDSPLTSNGEKQIKLLGQRMHYENFDLVFSSDLQRTLSTARSFADSMNREIILEPRLRERNLGILEGLYLEEIMAQYPQEYASLKQDGKDYVVPQGESIQQLLDRSLAVLEELHQQHQGKRIVLITHAGVIRVLFKYILGLDLDTPNQFRIPNTSLHQFSFNSVQQWTVDFFADTAHFQLCTPL